LAAFDNFLGTLTAFFAALLLAFAVDFRAVFFVFAAFFRVLFFVFDAAFRVLFFVLAAVLRVGFLAVFSRDTVFFLERAVFLRAVLVFRFAPERFTVVFFLGFEVPLCLATYVSS
jgi:hypothetical protein